MNENLEIVQPDMVSPDAPDVEEDPLSGIPKDDDDLLLEMTDWIIENEHLKGTKDFGIVSDEVKRLSGNRVSQKYSDWFEDNIPEDQNAFESFASGFATNSLEVGAGLDQMALQAASKIGIPGAKELEQSFTETMGDVIQDRKDTTGKGIAGFAGDVVSDVSLVITSPLKIPALPTSLKAKADALKPIYRKMIESGIELGALEGVKLVDDEGNRLSIAAGSAALGALTRGGLEKVADGFNALRGQYSQEFSKELKDLANQFDLDGLTVGQLRNSPGFQKFENLLDNLPLFGIAGTTRRQSESLKAAADRLVLQFGVPEDDIGSFLQGKVLDNYKSVKKVSDENYKAVEKAFKQTDEPVEYTNFTNNAEGILSKFENNKEMDEVMALVSKVRKMLPDDIEGGLGKREKSFEDAWAQLRILKKSKDRAIAEGDKNSADVYTGLVKGLEKDIQNLADNIGGVPQKLLSEANSFYGEKVMPFRKGKFGSITSGKAEKDPNFEPSSIFDFFVKKKDYRRRASNLKTAVGKEGEVAVKKQIMNDAYDQAISGETFNATKFAKELSERTKARDVFFSKAENEQIDGFVRLVEILPKRVTQPSEKQAVPLSRVGGVLGGTAAVSFLGGGVGLAGVAGGVKGASLLLTSKVGRSLLTKTSRAKSNKEIKSLMGKMNAEIARIMDKSLELSLTEEIREE